MRRNEANLLTVLPFNNPLHEAILANDTAFAIHLILNDPNAELINAKSLDNMPLVLSLKRGNMEIAQALLQHNKINVHCADGRGLTALHFACMLRQNRVISLLLDKGANPYFEVKPWISGFGKQKLIPLNLYCRNVSVAAFQACAVSHSNCFIDSPSMGLFGELAYTDIIFHIDALCINLWQRSDLSFAKLGSRLANGFTPLRTCDVFKYNFSLGFIPFCEHRNASPIDDSLIQRMNEMDIKRLQAQLKTAVVAYFPSISLFSNDETYKIEVNKTFRAPC